MKKKFLTITDRDIKIYDAETTPKELLIESLINFTYGFCANIMTPFIISKFDAGILVAFGLYYSMLSIILNRAKYQTKLGKFIIMPFTAALGAYLAIKIGFLISDLL